MATRKPKSGSKGGVEGGEDGGAAPKPKRAPRKPAAAKAVAKALEPSPGPPEVAAAKAAAEPTPKAKPRAKRAGGKAPAARARSAKKTAVEPAQEATAAPPGTHDPDGFFVARVRGEDEVRKAPHPLTEPAAEGGSRWREAPTAWEGSHPVLPALDERLGELPWSYGDDAFIALPRDPKTLFFYWDFSSGTVRAAFEGLDAPRAQLWILAATDGGWERVRTLEIALESRSFYVHDLAPGRTYRGELQAVDRHGNARRVGDGSNAVGLPPVGPSSVVDDRFVRLPWDVPLPRLLGPGRPGGAFPEDLRALLARLSDWGRFPEPTWGGGASGGGQRPSSPGFAPSYFPAGATGGEGK